MVAVSMSPLTTVVFLISKKRELKRVGFDNLLFNPEAPPFLFSPPAVIEVVVSPSLVISCLVIKLLLLSLVVRGKIRPAIHIKSGVCKKHPRTTLYEIDTTM